MVTSSHSSYAKRGKAPKIRKLGSFEPYVEPNMHNLYGSKPKKKRAQKPKIHKLGSREPRVHKPRTSEPRDYKWYQREHKAIPADVYPHGKDYEKPTQKIHLANGSNIIIKKNNYGPLGRPPRSSGTAVFHEYLINRNKLTPKGIKDGAPKFGQKWHKPKKARAKKATLVSQTRVAREPARKPEIRVEMPIRRR